MAVPLSAKKRTHKIEKLARIYDEEVLPVWGKPFARMILRGLAIPENSQVLDVACSTGYLTEELVRRMPPSSRIIAIDSASTLLDVARRKIEKLGTKSVFFRTESAEPRLSFADDVYDLVLCNLGLYEMADKDAALADFARVTKPGGQVRCTLLVSGSFIEFYDIFREVLLKHDKNEAIIRLDEHLRTYPTLEDCEQWLASSPLGDTEIHIEEITLLFRSSREFFFAPVIEHGPLPTWKDIAGQGQEMQDVFWYIKEAIDTYFATRAFQVTIKGACLIGTKVDLVDSPMTPRPASSKPPARRVTSARSEDETTVRSREGTSELDIGDVEMLPDDEDIESTPLGDVERFGDPGSDVTE